jgi:hypothetical protein
MTDPQPAASGIGTIPRMARATLPTRGRKTGQAHCPSAQEMIVGT